MKCTGEVIYKGIEKRSGGVFKNEKGQDIEYNASYVVKFDEIKDGTVNERKLKFPSSNTSLYEKFYDISPYTKAIIECDVIINNTICRLVPINVTEKEELNVDMD